MIVNNNAQIYGNIVAYGNTLINGDLFVSNYVNVGRSLIYTKVIYNNDLYLTGNIIINGTNRGIVFGDNSKIISANPIAYQNINAIESTTISNIINDKTDYNYFESLI